MIIDSLSLHNFRLFEDVSLRFSDRVSVIVGVNGAGKSSVLDAMSILLSCYVGGFDGIAPDRISRSDIRHVTQKNGSTFENVPQLPVDIAAMGDIAGASIEWKSSKSKDSAASSSPSAYAYVTALARWHQECLREGDAWLMLPLIAHYGTGRLWGQEAPKRRAAKQWKASFGRLAAYEDCLDAHLTDTLLAGWFERMTYKSLQQGQEIPEFAAVCQAVEKGLKSLTGYEELAIQSNLDTHELDVLYSAGGVPSRMPASQLSDGYRVALNLFADIAYRAAMLNPQLGSYVLSETVGIVLIDEIDLHLHPQWQQLVMADLAEIFPKVQFVVTTHAPAVISSVEEGQLIIVDGNEIHSVRDGFYGKDANATLREIMGVSERPQAVKNLFGRFYDLIDQGEYDVAEVVLDKLADLLGETDTELAACRVQLDLERMPLS